MKLAKRRIFPVLALVAVLGLVFTWFTMRQRTPAPELLKRNTENHITNRLSIATWNLGYGGLGEESDFKMDGGKSIRPPSKAVVLKNRDSIVEQIGKLDCDVLLLQELAKPSFMNYGVDLLTPISSKLEDYGGIYAADFKTRYMPGNLKVDTGLGIFWQTGELINYRSVPLEQEPSRFGLKKNYQVLVVELKFKETSYSIMNTHLAAFDENGEVRIRQARQVLDIANQEFTKGNRVIIGGDWNLILAATQFPNDTKDEHLFWLKNRDGGFLGFPSTLLMPDWTLSADSSTPTVRTLERAYKRDQNFRTVIDGFVSSPNVKVEEVNGRDFDFKQSDHQPVVLSINLD